MNRTLTFALASALLLVTALRLPAPIQEVPESPTPAPTATPTAKPKQKLTVKPKASESSESSTKRQTPSPQPKAQVTPDRVPFKGTWRGTLVLGTHGNVDFTLVINAAGTVVNDSNSHWPRNTYPAIWDGRNVTWHPPHQTNTLTPLPDGETAVVTSFHPGVIFDPDEWNATAVFRKMSP